MFWAMFEADNKIMSIFSINRIYVFIPMYPCCTPHHLQIDAAAAVFINFNLGNTMLSFKILKNHEMGSYI
jgi:hypothetical protein